MRIAIFTDTYYPETNGVSRTLQRLVTYLKKNGHQVMVVAPCYDELPEETGIWRLPSHPFFFYPTCRLAFPGQGEVEKRLAGFGPELVHIATPAGVGLSGRRYAISKNIPLVASYHTNYDQYLKHYGLEFLEPVYWAFLRWFHQPCGKNFCPSQSTQETLKTNGFENLAVWGRGVECREFAPEYRDEALREAWGAQDKTVLLYVGRLAKEKNIESLFEAYSLLDEKLQNITKLVIVGSGPLEEKLKGEAPPGTIFTGPLFGRQLSTAYASSDIFAFTSATETFGNVVLEAMASGLPVLAPRSGGVLDSLREGENGFGFADGDLQSFSKLIQRLVENQQFRKEISKGARKHALTQTWESIFGRLVTEYCSASLRDVMAG